MIAVLTSYFLVGLGPFGFMKEESYATEIVITKVSVATQKQNCTVREMVTISGNLTNDDVLAEDGLVAIEVEDSLSSHVFFRTVPTGSFSLDPLVDILEVGPWNSTTATVATHVALKTTIPFMVDIINNDNITRAAVIAVSVFDSSLICIGANYLISPEISPHSNTVAYIPVTIPEWTCIGGAKVVASVFSALPRNGGTPYCFEKSATFNVTRGAGTTVFQAPDIDTPAPAGYYNTSFKLTAEPRNGTYLVTASARSGSAKATESTTFGVTSMNAGIPPQASFTFIPANPFANQTVNFDASASSGEGYDDAIVKYEWDFDDGTTYTSTTSAYATHKFVDVRTYVVKLNVTDKEGLWSVTMKPLTTLSPTGPTANFAWTPIANLTMRFDASTSLPGWDGTGYAPIQTYAWDFGDGNLTTVSYPIIDHKYATSDDYSVTLTVEDSQHLQDSITQTVHVALTQYPRWDINQDGYTNAKDAVILGSHFGTRTGDPGYLEAADINQDGFINAKDAVILGAHFGQ
jgi:PKD repeat protein